MRSPRRLHVVLAIAAALAWAAYLAALRPPPVALSYPLGLDDVDEARCRDCVFVRRLAAESLRVFTPLAALPPAVPTAVVALEDQRFWSHHGIDWAQLWRAVTRDVASGSYRYGGSTITMQVARTLWLSREKRLVRKAREIAYALAVERRWSKQRILETYLNEVDFGRGLRGIGAASCYYFGVPATDLSEPRALALAAILPDPDHLGPMVAESPCAERP